MRAPGAWTQDGRTARRPIAWLFVVLAAFGIYTSLRYHYAEWGLDPDSIQDGILWLGEQAHGWAFLRTHDYSPDNWLFSLILPSIPLFDLVRPTPMLVVGLGWLSFLVTAVAAGIAARILGGPLVGLAVAAALLLSNIQTLGPYGFLSHPASHDLSLSWGLLAILLFHAWQAGGRWTALTIGTLLLAADSLSDPWTVIGIALPGLLAALVAALKPALRRRSIVCAVAIVVALVIAKTKLFGLLSFLLSSYTTIADRRTIVSHAWWLVRSLGTMLNPLPGVVIPGAAQDAVTVGLVAIILIWASILLIRANWDRGARLWLALTLVLSAPLPSAAFVVSDLPASFMIGRFSISLVVLFPVIVLSAFGAAMTVARRGVWLVAPTYVALVAMAGLVNGGSVWATPWRGMQTNGVIGLTHFLRDHDLRFGYGEYWGSEANAVTFWSHGDVIIRPVGFDPHDGHIYRRGGSPFWFKPSDIPLRGGQYFVAFKDDGENCLSVKLCETGVQQQFGPADARFTYEGLMILAWNRPIYLR